MPVGLFYLAGSQNFFSKVVYSSILAAGVMTAPTKMRSQLTFKTTSRAKEVCCGYSHELESRGLKTTRGKKTWSTTSIRSILTNEKYRGDVLLQKTVVVNFLTKETKANEGEAPQYYVTGHHEPIIEPAIWDQV